MQNHIEELRIVIRRLHGVESEHVRSVPIKEAFQGKTLWEGVVEVFYLSGHPKASIAYAWTHDTDDVKNPYRYVTVLHMHPIKSAQDAVRVAIAKDFRSGQPTAEEA